MGYNVSKNEAKKYGIARVKTGGGGDSGGSSMSGSIDKAYSEAKKQYTSMLPALSSRYSDLYTQLENERTVAQQQNTSLAGTEQTQLKSVLAKRGLDVNSSNPYYAGESSKLTGSQNLRSQATDVQYAGVKANTALDETKSILSVKSAIADTIIGESKDLTAASQWQKAFDYTKSKDAADRALEIYKASKSTSSSTNNSYKSALASAVSTALTGGYGSQNGIRENIAAILSSKFGGTVSEQTIMDDINKQLPNGWESRIMKTDKNSSAPEVQKVMDALGVDEATATKMIQNELGL
jgi:hypothetical protein